jgi:hypothetical protein
MSKWPDRLVLEERGLYAGGGEMQALLGVAGNFPTAMRVQLPDHIGHAGGNAKPVSASRGFTCARVCRKSRNPFYDYGRCARDSSNCRYGRLPKSLHPEVSQMLPIGLTGGVRPPRS